MVDHIVCFGGLRNESGSDCYLGELHGLKTKIAALWICHAGELF